MTKRSILATAALALAVSACNPDDGIVAPPGEVKNGPSSTDGGKPNRTDAKVNNPTGSQDAAMSAENCKSGTDEDYDKDGYTRADGDCNDCRPEVNPGALDLPGDNLDNDCDGEEASANATSCDDGLKIDSTDPEDAARAIGLCKFTSEDSKAWGVISARWTNASGNGDISSPLAAGILPSFGAAKATGDALLALSSGVARAPDQPDFTAACDTLDAKCPFGFCTGGSKGPPGYPKESSTCRTQGSIFQNNSLVFNQAALEVTIRVPNNVKALSFDSIFYTLEYPNFVCSKYNDFYVVFKEPKPAGVDDGNIVFDSNGDPIGVNTGLLAVCDPNLQLQNAQKRFDCAQGTGLLKGTGYGANESNCEMAGTQGGAATGWLHTTAPVEPGQVITLRFAVWDTNDAIVDSTVLIDNFQWSTDEAEVTTDPILI